MSGMSTRDIEALMAQFRRAGWRELQLRVGDAELFLSAEAGARSNIATQSSAPKIAATGPLDIAPPPPREPTRPASCITVLAPSLGSFFRATEPGSPAFADVGAHVAIGSNLCVIEVLKQFTPLRSGVAGIVREVYAKDGELVDFEQPLFLIEPHA